MATRWIRHVPILTFPTIFGTLTLLHHLRVISLSTVRFVVTLLLGGMLDDDLLLRWVLLWLLILLSRVGLVLSLLLLLGQVRLVLIFHRPMHRGLAPSMPLLQWVLIWGRLRLKLSRGRPCDQLWTRQVRLWL